MVVFFRSGQIKQVPVLTLLHPEWPKLHGVLAILSANRVKQELFYLSLDPCLVQVGLYFAHTYITDKIILAAAASMYGFD